MPVRPRNAPMPVPGAVPVAKPTEVASSEVDQPTAKATQRTRRPTSTAQEQAIRIAFRDGDYALGAVRSARNQYGDQSGLPRSSQYEVNAFLETLAAIPQFPAHLRLGPAEKDAAFKDLPGLEAKMTQQLQWLRENAPADLKEALTQRDASRNAARHEEIRRIRASNGVYGEDPLAVDSRLAVLLEPSEVAVEAVMSRLEKGMRSSGFMDRSDPGTINEKEMTEVLDYIGTRMLTERKDLIQRLSALQIDAFGGSLKFRPDEGARAKLDEAMRALRITRSPMPGPVIPAGSDRRTEIMRAREDLRTGSAVVREQATIALAQLMTPLEKKVDPIVQGQIESWMHPVRWQINSFEMSTILNAVREFPEAGPAEKREYLQHVKRQFESRITEDAMEKLDAAIGR